MSGKTIWKDDFYDYAEWHEWLEDNELRCEFLDNDVVLYFDKDGSLPENSCDQKSES